YFRDIRIAQEDSVYLDERPNGTTGNDLTIAVIRLPHISNYDDFDPLEEEGCTVHYVTQRFELGSPHLIIVPGTKSTVADLAYLRHSGLERIIVTKARAGTPVVGICGGYQMLGRQILDPQGVESENAEVAGLGLLDVVTEFAPEKSTRQVRARVLANSGLLAGTRGQELTGYEIHMGRTVSGGKAGAFQIEATPQGPADYTDGVLDAGGTVLGTYMHGLFHNDAFRQVFLDNLRGYWGLAAGHNGAPLEKDKEYDKLAALVRASLDIPRIYQIMEAGV
ncbi:MAG: cobyric acid synthase CobQ, partial [Chloroflexota bacterium]